jgi:hypothetical protein
MAQPGHQTDDPGRAAVSQLLSANDVRETLTRNVATALNLDPREARDLDLAILDDPAMATIVREEIIAQEDHRLALRANDQINSAPDADMAAIAEEDSNATGQLELIAQLAGLWVSESAARSLVPDKMREMGDGDINPARMDRICTACTETKGWYASVTAPCNHTYCGDCLKTLFQDSLKDETLFPPRCCNQPIPIDNMRTTIHLPKTIIDQYPLRKAEVESIDRTYCFHCAVFILPAAISDNVATCACGADTCTLCKRARHPGRCRVDRAEREVIALARAEGWQRCPRCRAMVELNFGCNHMTYVTRD